MPTLHSVSSSTPSCASALLCNQARTDAPVKFPWRVVALGIAVILLTVSLWATSSGSGGSAGSTLRLGTQLLFARANRACSERNESVVEFARRAIHEAEAGREPLIPQSTSFDGFVKEVKVSLDKHMLPVQTIHWIFRPDTEIHPKCSGDWMEFGVFTGGSVNHTATWRKEHCDPGCPPVYGWDTFTGLPEVWAQQEGDVQFAQGMFDLEGRFPAVVDNVRLIAGLFSNSIPPFLDKRAKAGEAVVPLAYLHVDCDLYAGAHDVFTLLSHKIVPGTLILFDELINYRLYRLHEIKAFYEWLQVSGAKVATIGVKGPIDEMQIAMDIDIAVKEHHWVFQSAAFVVVSKPGHPSLLD